jgi:hypothetical protein
MKRWKIIVCLISVVFFVMAATACQQSSATNTSVLRGTINKDSNTGMLYLRSAGKRFKIESQQDLSAMIRKTVEVSGTVTEKDGKPVIVADSVTPE